jgi:hypothetical protein
VLGAVQACVSKVYVYSTLSLQLQRLLRTAVRSQRTLDCAATTACCAPYMPALYCMNGKLLYCWLGWCYNGPALPASGHSCLQSHKACLGS